MSLINLVPDVDEDEYVCVSLCVSVCVRERVCV